MLRNFETIEKMETYISNRIYGAFSLMDMYILTNYVKRLKKGDLYLEIGVDWGKSIASAIFQAKDGVKFYCCDIADRKVSSDGRSPSPKLTRQEWFELAKLNRVAEFILGDSKDVAKTWDKGELSMIFIDADHSYEGCKTDILSWIPYLKKGGYILFHDYDITSPGVIQAVDELIKNSPDFDKFFYAPEKYELKSSIAGARKR